MPEKYQVKGKDGVIDEAASVRAVAKGYTELSKRMVEVGLPPETSDKYEFTDTPKGVDVAQLRKDPEMASFLKSCHSQGMTNKQVSMVINSYLEIAPKLAGASQEINTEEAVTNLRERWKTEIEFDKNVSTAKDAAVALGARDELTFDDIVSAGLANNSVFIRLMAALGKQTQEDTVFAAAGGANIDSKDFDAQVAELRKELALVPERDRKTYSAVLGKIDALYTKRHGNKPQGMFHA